LGQGGKSNAGNNRNNQRFAGNKSAKLLRGGLGLLWLYRKKHDLTSPSDFAAVGSVA
jgi:hypothetical protein